MAKINYDEEYKNAPHSDILSDVVALVQEKIGLSMPVIMELAYSVISDHNLETIHRTEKLFGIKLNEHDHRVLRHLMRAEKHLYQSKRALLAVLNEYQNAEVKNDGE